MNNSHPSIAPLPANETARLAALKSYHILDTAEEKDFDDLTTLASAICQTPVALVTFIEEERQWFKSHKGTDVTETPIEYAFCTHAIASLEPIMVVNDATKDERFANNPLVTGDPNIAFYAGVPLRNKDGFGLGSLCVLDVKARELSPEQTEALKIVGRQVMEKLEARRSLLNMQTENRGLQASGDRFRSLVEQAPVAIAIYEGPDLIISQANEQMLKMVGRTEEIVGLPLLVARPELAGHPVFEMLNEIVQTGKEVTRLAFAAPIRENGQVKEGYFDSIYKPIKDDQGNVTAIMLVATDVTDKILANQREEEITEELAAVNEELRTANEELTDSQKYLTTLNENLFKSESRFRTLIDQSPVAIGSLRGRELVVDIANEMILHIWGKDKSVIGKPIHIALPEIQGQPFLQLLDDVYTSGKPYYGSEAPVALVQNGELENLFVNFVYQPILGADGHTTDIMVVAIDVTEQVNARHELKVKNEELSLLAEQLAYVRNTIPQQVWTATPDGMLDSVNDQTLAYFGKNADEITGENWIKFVHPDDLKKAGEAWGKSLTSGEPYQTEFRLLSKSGEYVWHLARAVPFREDGKITKWFGTNTDINGHKLLEQHKTDFISIASHELKTPITSLKATLQLLDRVKHQPPPILPKLIEQANRGMQKISSLVEDLLSVSRMNDGQLHLNRSWFTVTDLINNSCSHIKLEGGHELITEGDTDIKLHADQHLIEQVVINFVNNAIKYAPLSKVVRLRIEQANGEIKILVHDNGPGIAADKIPHLFDRYYRVDHSGQQYSGLGLGLYICSEIIKRHEGKIGVESQPGKGSTFWFSLPVE